MTTCLISSWVVLAIKFSASLIRQDTFLVHWHTQISMIWLYFMKDWSCFSDSYPISYPVLLSYDPRSNLSTSDIPTLLCLTASFLTLSSSAWKHSYLQAGADHGYPRPAVLDEMIYYWALHDRAVDLLLFPSPARDITSC